mmetsp:Transcript_24324/g.46313  ORF Transcript_24324/g.46313 Transcript_24324/m.46313 type:complete len:105 (+) Transcript_24324:2989-3303(+)
MSSLLDDEVSCVDWDGNSRDISSSSSFLLGVSKSLSMINHYRDGNKASQIMRETIHALHVISQVLVIPSDLFMSSVQIHPSHERTVGRAAETQTTWRGVAIDRS